MMQRPRPCPAIGRDRGLTLIELMIGLGIAAILMSLAVPSFSTYLQRQRLKAAALGLELDLQDARFESARRGVPLHVIFQPGAEWCYAITTTPECGCRSAQPCRLKSVRGGDRRGVQMAEFHPTRFDPASGKSDLAGTAAVLQATGQERVRVGLTAAGRPFVCMAQGSLTGIAAC